MLHWLGDNYTDYTDFKSLSLTHHTQYSFNGQADERTKEWTDGKSPILQDFVPFRDRCPKRNTWGLANFSPPKQTGKSQII